MNKETEIVVEPTGYVDLRGFSRSSVLHLGEEIGIIEDAFFERGKVRFKVRCKEDKEQLVEEILTSY